MREEVGWRAQVWGAPRMVRPEALTLIERIVRTKAIINFLILEHLTRWQNAISVGSGSIDVISMTLTRDRWTYL